MDGIDCFGNEIIETAVINLLKDIFLDDDLNIFKLTGIQAWLVSDMHIENSGVVVELCIF